MAFRAVHADWGPVSADLDDLGCGRAWAMVHKTRPQAPLTCDECGHRMYAKHRQVPNDLRFFVHAPGAPTCALGLESVAHHLLKLSLAVAAREAGAHAELEVRGPSGWRADVLATDPTGAWSFALEAQLAAITPADILARTRRMAEDRVGCCWFSDRPAPPWLGTVPSARLAAGEDGSLVVAEGVAKFPYTRWCPVAPVDLPTFLGWMFAGHITPHRLRLSPLSGTGRDLDVVWTAPQYIRLEQRQHQAESVVTPAAYRPGADFQVLRAGADAAEIRRFVSRIFHA